LYEFWVVCTRPINVNGLGKTAAEAALELANLKGLFMWLDETPAIYGVWEQLVASTPVVGKNAHDARFIAAMKPTGVGRPIMVDKVLFHIPHSYRGSRTARLPSQVVTS
jgi:hypothetical protein